MNKAATTLSFIILMFPLGFSSAGETRISTELFYGFNVVEDDAGDELTSDIEVVGLSATYFLGESGPFFGVGIGQEEADNFELDDVDQDLASVETDIRSATLGYRSGSKGNTQFMIAVSRHEMEIDDNPPVETTTGLIGIERDLDDYRYSFSGRYEEGDEESRYGVNIGATFFLAGNVGLILACDFSGGETGPDSESSNNLEVRVGTGIELRF